MKRLVRLAAIVVMASGLTFLSATSYAVSKCSVTVDGRTGVILVSAMGVGGSLRWGDRSGTETGVFANDATCVNGTKASKCQLGATTPTITPEAITPPDLCSIYLTDGVAECAAHLKGCTPGTRSASRFGIDTSMAQQGSGGRECNLGEVWLVAGTRAASATPADGRIIAIGQNTSLYSLIGNTYGGDLTQNTFALPDLRGAAPNGLTYVMCTTGIFPGP